MIDLATAGVDDAVWQLRPDYAACLVTARGVPGGPSDEASDVALTRAERYAAQLLDAQDLAAIAQVAQWREAFRAFGVRPPSATSSLESLLRRAAAGLPRIDRLTDHYNAISIAHRGGSPRSAPSAKLVPGGSVRVPAGGTRTVALV